MKQSMTLEQFNTWYWKNFPKSSYRRGQAFLNLFIKDDKAFFELWHEKDENEITNLVWKIIFQYNWDCNNLVVVRPELLKV